MAAMQKFETEIKIQLDRAEKVLSKSDYRLLLSEITQDIDERSDRLDDDELEDDDEDEGVVDSDLEDWNSSDGDDDQD